MQVFDRQTPFSVLLQLLVKAFEHMHVGVNDGCTQAGRFPLLGPGFKVVLVLGDVMVFDLVQLLGFICR